jgi:predicted CDP-diglyceride synthetase/phosphatidate cytidylyltransferase
VIAYAPMIALPALSAIAITLVAATIGVVSLVSFARMVGLTRHPRSFALTLLSSLAFYVAARAHWYGLFQAMPVFAMFLVAAAETVRAEPGAFLQRMSLSWLGLLVYGYLLAHAALFTDTDLGRLPPAGVWLSVILFCAKASDVAWEASRRLGVKGEDAQIPVSMVGGAIGGAGAHLALSGALTLPQMALFGLIVGLGVGAASRTYKLIVTDVLGEDPARPMKGTMLFGFAFALALAYHYVRYMA